MKEYKITKERLKAMAEECPEAEGILKKGFPEAFKVPAKWEDITGKISWKLEEYSDGFLMWGFLGKDNDDGKIVYFGTNGLFLNNKNNDIYKIEEATEGLISGTDFRVLKRRGK